MFASLQRALQNTICFVVNIMTASLTRAIAVLCLYVLLLLREPLTMFNRE